MSDKTRSDPKDVRKDDEVCHWKGLNMDFCASHPDVVWHQPGIQMFGLNEGLSTCRIHQICPGIVH
jgi:hypothetical protein